MVTDCVKIVLENIAKSDWVVLLYYITWLLIKLFFLNIWLIDLFGQTFYFYLFFFFFTNFQRIICLLYKDWKYYLLVKGLIMKTRIVQFVTYWEKKLNSLTTLDSQSSSLGLQSGIKVHYLFLNLSHCLVFKENVAQKMRTSQVDWNYYGPCYCMCTLLKWLHITFYNQRDVVK